MEHSLDLKTLNVLIVEDTSLMRAMHRKNLAELGFSKDNLYEAENGQLALGVLNQIYQAKKKVDLIICDWDMPVLSGLEFLKKLRTIEITKKVMFVMVTGHDKKEDYAQLAQYGVNGIVIKPFKAELYNKKIIEVVTKIMMSNI